MRSLDLWDSPLIAETTKLGAAVVEIERLRAEIERLRTAFETESRLREHWGRQWEEQYAENERLREALSDLYAADIAPRDANHGRAWQNALRKAEAALRKPEEPK